MPAKYQMIAQDLRTQMLSNQSLKSYKLPTEHDLCLRYQVSRQTVRQARLTLRRKTDHKAPGKWCLYHSSSGTSSQKEDCSYAF